MGRKHRYRFCCDEGKSSLFGSLGLFFFFAWVLLVLKVVVLVFCSEVFALIIVVMKT